MFESQVLSALRQIIKLEVWGHPVRAESLDFNMHNLKSTRSQSQSSVDAIANIELLNNRKARIPRTVRTESKNGKETLIA